MMPGSGITWKYVDKRTNGLEKAMVALIPYKGCRYCSLDWLASWYRVCAKIEASLPDTYREEASLVDG